MRINQTLTSMKMKSSWTRWVDLWVSMNLKSAKKKENDDKLRASIRKRQELGKKENVFMLRKGNLDDDNKTILTMDTTGSLDKFLHHRQTRNAHKNEKAVEVKEDQPSKCDSCKKDDISDVHEDLSDENIISSIPIENLKFLKRVGRGGNGTTYRGSWSTNDKSDLEVAIKVAAITEQGKEGWETEVHLLQSLRFSHPNVIQIYGYSSMRQSQLSYQEAIETRCLVMEYCNAGDLSAALRLRTPRNFVLKTSKSISKGMAFLHENGIIHRDLKPENILLHGEVFPSGNFQVKVADLGLGKLISQKNSEHTAETGTYRYMAPEVIKHEHYSFKVDVYSFGILLWELITRQPPFSCKITQVQAAAEVTLHKARPKLPTGIPKPLSKIIKKCWQENPDKRPTFNEIDISLDQFDKAMTAKQKAWLDEPYGHKVYL